MASTPSELLMRILNDQETPEESRQRRRRRLYMRRLVPSPPPSPSSSSSAPAPDQPLPNPTPAALVDTTSSSSSEEEEDNNPVIAVAPLPSLPSLTPGHGGRARGVDLNVNVNVNVNPLPMNVNPFPVNVNVNPIAITVNVNPMPVTGSMAIQGLSKTMDDRVFVKENFCRSDLFGGNPLHFFGVYDGHGGSRVSALCKRFMHKIVAEELETMGELMAPSGGGGVVAVRRWEDLVRAALETSFIKMDYVAMTTCGCEKSAGPCKCGPMDMGFSGSTAVVAILTPGHVVVANCGDSRAVLCRAGMPFPLSFDHKVF